MICLRSNRSRFDSEVFGRKSPWLAEVSRPSSAGNGLSGGLSVECRWPRGWPDLSPVRLANVANTPRQVRRRILPAIRRQSVLGLECCGRAVRQSGSLPTAHFSQRQILSLLSDSTSLRSNPRLCLRMIWASRRQGRFR